MWKRERKEDGKVRSKGKATEERGREWEGRGKLKEERRGVVNCPIVNYCDVYTHLHFKQYTPGWYQSMKSALWLLPIFHAQHSELRDFW